MRVEGWAPDGITAAVERAAMDGLERAANIIAQRAREKFPLGKPKGKTGQEQWKSMDTGKLRSTIRVVRLKGDPNLNVRIYAGSKKAPYANFIEHGTIKLPKRPFLRPALNMVKKDIVGLVTEDAAGRVFKPEPKGTWTKKTVWSQLHQANVEMDWFEPEA